MLEKNTNQKNDIKKEIQYSNEKIALVLGGGGARGFAHVGAIKAFEEHNINFDFVVGASVGAFVGALYCDGMTAMDMKREADLFEIREIHNGIWLVPNRAAKIGNLVTRLLGDKDIEHLKKRFIAVATDIKEGRQHIMEKGDLSSAVAASCCAPIAYRPVVRNNFHLVDGGLLNNIPADIAKMLGATKVVTIDINPTRGSGTNSLKTFEVVKATLSIIFANSSTKGLLNSDVIIEPDLSKFKSTSKAGYETMIRLGYEAAEEKIEEIKKMFVSEENTIELVQARPLLQSNRYIIKNTNQRVM